MFHPYTISLNNGKYTVVNNNGLLKFLRHGEAWPGADDLKHSKVVLAMAQRIEELEIAIGEVLNGTVDAARGERRADGMSSYGVLGPDATRWQAHLRRALEQK